MQQRRCREPKTDQFVGDKSVNDKKVTDLHRIMYQIAWIGQYLLVCKIKQSNMKMKPLTHC